MQTDIVIVGAGMVGLSMANALSLYAPHLKIALIDPALAQKLPPKSRKKRFDLEDFNSRVSAISLHNQQFLTELNAWQQIPSARICHYQHMQVWDGLGTSDIAFHAAQSGLPSLGAIVENQQIEQALRRALSDKVQQIAQAVKYIDSPNQGQTPVVLENGQRLHCSLLIAADGARSRIRTQVGFAMREWDYKQHALVCNVQTEQSMQHTAWQRFSEYGPLAFLPLGEDAQFASIVFSASVDKAQSMLQMSGEALAEELGKQFEQRLGRIVNISSAQVIPLRQRHAKRYVKQGVVLIGDAAHSIHPLAGQGVNLGFKDAKQLAQCLAPVELNNQTSLKRGLSSYEARRMPDNLATMAAMEGFKRLYSVNNPWLILARNQGMRWFDRSSWLKRQLIKQACGTVNS